MQLEQCIELLAGVPHLNLDGGGGEEQAHDAGSELQASSLAADLELVLRGSHRVRNARAVRAMLDDLTACFSPAQHGLQHIKIR